NLGRRFRPTSLDFIHSSAHASPLCPPQPSAPFPTPPSALRIPQYGGQFWFWTNVYISATQDIHAKSQRLLFDNSENECPASGSSTGSQTVPVRAARPIGTRFSSVDAQNPGG